MKIDISNITKIDGASLTIDINEKLEDLNSVEEGFVFDNPVSFIGQIVNVNGVMKLNGHLNTEYKVICYRCLKEITKIVSVDIKESFINVDKNEDSEAYTYEGNSVIIDKVLKDYIILNLPMKQLCNMDCKGLCTKCGIDFNISTCNCKEQNNAPQFEALKDYFKH